MKKLSDGIINIYKEKGYTSHDVVAKLRRITGIRKIGHTGTLDPDAEGVLPVCIGKATKLCSYLTDKDKEYIAKVKPGIVTDTLDMSGNIIKEQRYVGDAGSIIRAAESFVGTIMQTPPMYSAIKVNGKKLYELARDNIEIERKQRKVHIYSLEITDIDLDKQEFTLKAHVSKGTYIRSLCDDIGKKLGCGACMAELVRTRSGIFDIKDSLTLTQVENVMNKAGLTGLYEHMTHIEDVFTADCVIMKKEYDMRVKNGNFIFSDMFMPYDKEKKTEPFIDTNDAVAVYLSDGTFKAIYQKKEKAEKKDDAGNKDGADTYFVLTMF